MAEANLLRELLKGSSRSFYLTLRILPAKVRRPVGIAYLLARTSDTIADTSLVPASERLAALSAFSDRVHLGAGDFSLAWFTAAAGPDLGERPAKASNTELRLLAHCRDVLAALEELDSFDREQVRAVLETIVSGQSLDLGRFAAASIERVIALGTETDLEDYTYRVAGCVGGFWTRICQFHLFPRTPLDPDRLVELGVQFGQGLQLVNILRDLPTDLRQGRCYIPADRLQAVHLHPAQLLDSASMPAFRALYDHYLDQAVSRLTDGWTYTNLLPATQVRLRLACAWPILIGAKTIVRLRTVNVLDANHRVKIPRGEVRRLIAASVWCYPWRRAWERLFRQAQI